MFSPGILVEVVVSGGHRVEFEPVHGQGISGIEPAREFRHGPKSIHHKLPVGFGNDEFNSRVGAQERQQRVRIQMIRVIVGGEHHIDEIKSFRVNDALRHADVRLFCVRVFAGERIGKVRVDKEMFALPLEQKAALPQPPQVKVFRFGASYDNIFQEELIFEQRLNHRRQFRAS